MRDEDPREALLKYADVAGKEKMFTGAWEKTQPVTLFRESDSEPEDDEGRNKRVKVSGPRLGEKH